MNRIEAAPVEDGFDDDGIDVLVVVRSHSAAVLEDATKLDSLAESVHRIVNPTELHPYVTFVSEDELAAA